MVGVIALVVGMVGAPGPSQATASPPQVSSVRNDATPSPSGEAYYQFLLGRQLEGEGDIDGAVQAYRRAAAADPLGAEIRAELAGLYARQNRGEDAISAAEEALRLDPDNVEAHAVLGGVYAARVHADRESAMGGIAYDAAARAIEHYEKARSSRRYDVGLQLTLGRLYMGRSQFRQAIDVLVEVVAREPGVNEAAWLLAQAYEGAGRRQDAIATLEDAVASEPRFYRALVSLGELYERERRWADAAGAYGRAADQSPRTIDLRVRQASALLSGGQPARARDVLLPVAAANPTDASVLYVLAEAHREAKDLDAAEAAARRLLALEPGSLRGAYALAMVFDERHDSRGVVAALQPAVEQGLRREPQSPQLSPVLVRLGYAYQELGEYDEAIKAFERAQALSPDPPSLDPFVAQAYVAAGRHERALAFIQQARQKRPGDARLVRLEAEALRESGKVDAAIELLLENRTRFTDDADVQLALGAVLAEGGRADEAVEVFDEVDRRFPGRVDVPFQRGAALERAKRYAAAEAAFRDALGRDPLHAPTLNYFGYMLADRGERLDEAVSLVERALEIDPGNPSYLDSLGWAWYQKGDYERAKQYLVPAAERLPRNSVVQDHLGDLLMKLGDRAGAVTAWERALVGDGESVDPEIVRGKISEGRRVP